MRLVSMKCFLFVVSLALLLGPCGFAQSASDKLVEQAKNPSNAIPMKAISSVPDCIAVEAVLLPRKPAAMLFSGYVADHYAVVKTTVSNHCSDLQFVLHNIYFDYRDWALSGVYSGLDAAADATKPGTSASSTQKSADQCSSTPPPDGCFTKGSQAGQVATVGALDVQDQVTEDSVFSRRNLVVNGLTLVGTVAQGYAFVGGPGVAMGIGAFNGALVPAVSKFWPDRRIDQEKFILALGYRTDQSTVIAKDDHGSYFVFFPLSTFLTPSLKKLFLEDSAVFLNPAEAWLEPGALNVSAGPGAAPLKSSHKQKEDLDSIRSTLTTLAQAIPGNTVTSPTPAKLILELSSRCTEEKCDICLGDAKCVARILAEKYLFKHASLNSVQIVVRGVMTIDLNSVPPRIDEVKFDNEATGAKLWTVTPAAAKPDAGKPAAAAAKPPDKDAAKPVDKNATEPAAAGADAGAASPDAGQKKLTGVITGKFLSGGTPSIVAITVPGVEKLNQTDYIADKSLAAGKSSDSSLAFTLGLIKTLPSASTITFQVSRTNSDSATDDSAASSAGGASTQLTSNKYVYVVNYGSPAATPAPTKVTIENDTKTDAWQTPGTLAGTVIGTDLTGGTVKVSALEIAGKPATAREYIGVIAAVPDTSSATSLEFTLKLLQKVPDGSTVSFVVSTKSGDTTLDSKPVTYTVTKLKAAPAKPAAPKRAPTSPKPIAKKSP